MEFEQIIKQLEWLDKRERDNRGGLSTLDGRLTSIEATLNSVNKQIKTLNKEFTEILPTTNRLGQFDTILSRQRADIIKLVDENDKARAGIERENTKKFQTELNDLSKGVSNLKTIFNGKEVKGLLKEHTDKILRILNNVSDLKLLNEKVARTNDEVSHSLKAAEETRKTDLKRVADIQGEITSLRKRIDESRDKSTITADGLRNLENRFTDLIGSELERKQTQTVFLDQQSLAQIERERVWKEWKEKFSSFQKDSDTHIKSMDEILSGAKKAQETYLDLNAKLERRINEVTEMQRLVEDRLRQEWVSFKTDDQKRWTGHSLSSEESFRDIRKDLQKSEGRITSMDNAVQILQDQMHQTTDTTEKELQELMNVVHEWMTSYQRIMGHGKKTKK